jgi:LysR family transcriptional regulator for metE and metH
MRQLTELLGMEVFERAPDGLRPTPAGFELLAAVERIEAVLGETIAAIVELSGAEGGRVAVGIISTAKYFAPRALAAYRREHPRVDLSLLIGNRKTILSALRAFDLDLAITGRPPEDFPVEQAAIGPHPHVIIASPAHPLAGERAIPLAALGRETFLMREEGSGSRDLAQRLLAEAALAPPIGFEIGSNETIKQAVMAELGIAVISAHTIAAEVADRRLVILDVIGLPIVRQWFVVKHRDKRLLPAARALWAHLTVHGHAFLPEVVPPERAAGD